MVVSLSSSRWVACPLLFWACSLFTTSDERSPLPVCWSEPQRQGVAWGRPAIAGDIVVFAEGDGSVTARDQGSGKVRWTTRVDTAGALGRNLIARGGVVVVPVVRWTVGLDLATGQERWRYHAPLDTRENAQNPKPGGVVTRIDSDDVSAFVPAWGASVSAIELATGRVRWTWTPGDTVSFRSGADGVRVSGDTVYATVWHNITALGGSSEHWLVALDRNTGRELWRLLFPSYTGGVIFMGAPSVYRDLVIFQSVGGHEWAVNRFTRQFVWHFTPTPFRATIAQTELFGDVAYHDGGDNNIYALRAADGSVLWKAAVDAQPLTDILVTERHVVVNAQATLNIIERASGKRVVTARQPGNSSGSFQSAPASARERIYLAAQGAAICFVEPR